MVHFECAFKLHFSPACIYQILKHTFRPQFVVPFCQSIWNLFSIFLKMQLRNTWQVLVPKLGSQLPKAASLNCIANWYRSIATKVLMLNLDTWQYFTSGGREREQERDRERECLQHKPHPLYLACSPTSRNICNFVVVLIAFVARLLCTAHKLTVSSSVFWHWSRFQLSSTFSVWGPSFSTPLFVLCLILQIFLVIHVYKSITSLTCQFQVRTSYDE